jgi:hypothetical protein
MSPRVTVVMAAYNSAATIGAAISSVLWQTYPDLDLVVVDDGSTDATARIVASFNDSRITLLKQSNAGAGAARNRGMLAADGELLTFLDSDDILFDRHVDALLATWAHGARIIATANSYWLLPGGIDTSHTTHKGRFPAANAQRLSLLEQNFLSPMSLFSRRLFDEIGGFDTTLPRSEDWDFWLRAVFAGYRVVHQSVPLSLFRWSASSLSTDTEAVFAADRAILERMQARDDLTGAERTYLTRRMASPPPRLLGNLGDAELRDRNYAAAARNYRAAALLIPSETMLNRKARLMRPAPGLVGPLLRRRQLRREKALGFDARFDH